MRDDPPAPPTFRVVFRPLPGVDGIRALRRALKFALRACRLRCISLSNAIAHFVKGGAPRGRLIMPCGTGKSLTAFFIAEQLNPRTLVVAVPSLALIAQSLKVWTREFLARGEVPDWFIVCSAEDTGDISDDDFVGDTYQHSLETNTSPDTIVAWLGQTKNSERRVIFVTYQSGPKFAEAAREVDLTVDFMVFDEAHKTVGAKHKKFAYLIFNENVQAKHRMFMTATERVPQSEDDRVLSMDDVTMYGEQFHLLTYKKAVDQDIICDYDVVIMAVSRTETVELVRRNALINTGIDGLDEAQAMQLATGIALKKMYQDRKIKHAISFHSSIFKAEQFRKQQDALNNIGALGPPVVNLHISSKRTTTKRKQLIREFPTYERALMTNARCLTEGVDIPAVDCVVFADRKNSTVDIVQASGRAMRTAPGKDKGHILIPLVVDDDVDAKTIEVLAKKSEFREIARIVTALSTNDERIVDEFRLIYDGKKPPSNGGVIKIDGSVRLGHSIELDKFAEAIQAKLWERIARSNWRSFGEAREYVRNLGLKSRAQWDAYCKSAQRPPDIPTNPNTVYALEGWVGMGDWLGTGTIATHLRQYRPFEEARTFVHGLGLKSQSEWNSFATSVQLPVDLPKAPHMVYANEGWSTWGDWLGSGVVATYKLKYRTFEQARGFARTLGLKSREEWLAFARTGKLPTDIPFKPERAYADQGWAGMGDWLGTGTIATGLRQYRPFNEARTFVHTLGLKSAKEWRAYSKTEGRPPDLPTNPHRLYASEGWISWADWIGTATIATNQRPYRSFGEARVFVHSLGLKSANEWRTYTKSGKLPADIPAGPSRTYANEGWLNWGDWLGTIA
jgi:superfamily II DNA or RNA helicase